MLLNVVGRRAAFVSSLAVLSALTAVGCANRGADAEDSGAPSASGGTGTTPTGGQGGGRGGTGGTATGGLGGGGSGLGGAAAGGMTGAGASTGMGGASSGTAGASGGTGGASTGTGGASSGAGGTRAGAGGAAGGAGGARAGSGGTSSGIGGVAGGAGGRAGSGGATAGTTGAGGGGPPPPFTGPTIAGSVTVTRATVTGQVAPRFVGLSFEKTHMTDGFFTAQHAPLIALFKLLGPSNIRIGGNDVDYSVWSPTATFVTPGTTSRNVGTAEVDALADFLTATGWQAIYGVDLKNGTPSSAAAEVTYASARLAGSLAAVEIGNEINFFGAFATVDPEWESFATAVLKAVPGVPLAGPASGSDPSFDVPFAAAEASRLVLLTHHYYRAGAGSAAATMANLLTPDPQVTSQGHTVSTAATGNKIRDGFRWGEMNSFSGHGQAGVSDAFGSALWSIDFMMTAAQIPACAGVNFHGGGQNEDGNSCPSGPTSCSKPFRYSPIDEVNSRVTGAAPLFYGLLLMTQAGTGNVLQTKATAGSLNFTAYTIAQADGSTSVLLVNKDATTGVNASVDIGTAPRAATALFLRAPSLSATSGVTLGEAAISPAGAWTPHPAFDVPVSGDVVEVVVPPATAVLVRAQ